MVCISYARVYIYYLYYIRYHIQTCRIADGHTMDLHMCVQAICVYVVYYKYYAMRPNVNACTLQSGRADFFAELIIVENRNDL